MTNLLKAEKTINFPNNVSYKARMSLEIMMQIESAIGTSFLKVAQRLSSGELTLTEIITIITLSIRGGGNNIEEKDIRKLVSEMGLKNAIAMTGDLLTLALAESDSGNLSDEEKKSES